MRWLPKGRQRRDFSEEASGDGLRSARYAARLLSVVQSVAGTTGCLSRGDPGSILDTNVASVPGACRAEIACAMNVPGIDWLGARQVLQVIDLKATVWPICG